APLFRANSIMNEEQPVRIVFSLDFSEARVVAAPVRLLPVFLEVIALAHIRSGFPCDGSKLIHALVNALRGFLACLDRWLMPGNSRICGSLAGARDCQREGGQHGGTRCSVRRPSDCVGRRSGESLVEVQSDT